MTITFITNYVNHHQIPLADEFYKLLGNDYHYVTFSKLPDEFLSKGYPLFERRYIIKSYESINEYQKAITLINASDVVIVGAASAKLVNQRVKENKITFHYNERWFKTGLKILLKPHVLLDKFLHHYRFRNKRLYMLCASAYTASDANSIGCYKGKCFKWGYFTRVSNCDIEKIFEASNRDATKIKILYVSRFLSLKHPEIPIGIAIFLRNHGIDFELNMYGTGPEYDKIKNLISQNNLENLVKLKGFAPNDEVLSQMRQSHIFLFTSDRNEGWGAVVGEAMANFCAVIASRDAGCVPYLIKDGVNGIVCQSENQDEFNQKTINLIMDANRLRTIRLNARKTMTNLWNPENAAKRFVALVDRISQNSDLGIFNDGPLSLDK